MLQLPDGPRTGLPRHPQQHVQLQRYVLGRNRAHLQGQHRLLAQEIGAKAGQHGTDLCSAESDTDAALD